VSRGKPKTYLISRDNYRNENRILFSGELAHPLRPTYRLWFLSNNSCKSRIQRNYRGADKSLARPISRCILSDGENISFDASLVLYI